MEHLVTLAAAAMAADKAFSEAFDAAKAATDPTERVRLDLAERKALRASTLAKLAYQDALDAHNAAEAEASLDDLSLERRRAGYAQAAE